MTSNNPVTYINISDTYGDAVEVTIDDYIELNPDGGFDARIDGIYEDDELIARPLDNTRKGEIVASSSRLSKLVSHQVTMAGWRWYGVWSGDEVTVGFGTPIEKKSCDDCDMVTEHVIRRTHVLDGEYWEHTVCLDCKTHQYSLWGIAPFSP